MIYPNGPKTARRIFGVHVCRPRFRAPAGRCLPKTSRLPARRIAMRLVLTLPALPSLFCLRPLLASNFRASRRPYLYLLIEILSIPCAFLSFQRSARPFFPISVFGRSIRILFFKAPCQAAGRKSRLIFSLTASSECPNPSSVLTDRLLRATIRTTSGEED